MKLLSKYNRANILATVIVLLLSGFSYYVIIRYILIHQLDKDLKVEEQEIVDYVKTYNELPPSSNYKEQEVSFQVLNELNLERRFSSVDIFDKNENGYISERQLVFPVAIGQKKFKATVLKSQEETEDLIQLILVVTLSIIILLLLLLFIINRFLFNKLWQPFKSTLLQLKQFNLSTNPALYLEETSITEFFELNQAVNIMAARVIQDYNSLKIFAENASHEMQTPLAVINSKLDILIQGDLINAFQMQQLQVIYNMTNKLSRLVQALLLLTKIENEQFDKIGDVSLELIIEEKLKQFEDLIADKKISVITYILPVTISGNKQLVEILINNLLGNAIRYNKKNGRIEILLNINRLSISNTSHIPLLDKQQLFQRFYRHANTNEEGNGLGLSIIKQICNTLGYKIQYEYLTGLHEFSILFN